MIFTDLEIDDVKLLNLRAIKDERGFFVEHFRQDKFDQNVGQHVKFVQENFSVSKNRYTVRGLHAQMEPHAQGKLIRCVRGKIRDVAVDVRPGSASFGQSVMVDLSSDDLTLLWIPEGFLHGFITLEDDTEVSYKCTNYYAPDKAVHVDWQDRELGITWGVDPLHAVISEKDKKALSFKDFQMEFIASN